MENNFNKKVFFIKQNLSYDKNNRIINHKVIKFGKTKNYYYSIDFFSSLEYKKIISFSSEYLDLITDRSCIMIRDKKIFIDSFNFLLNCLFDHAKKGQMFQKI